MPEENGDIPLTGDPRVDAALQRIRGKFQDLEDAMLVQAHLEKRMAEQLKEHAEWLIRHERTMAHLETTLAEIGDKLNLMIEREMRREGGPETT